MKKVCVSVLILLLAALSLFGCRRSGYTLLDIPKELEIDVAALSEDVNDRMSVEESTPLLAALPEEELYVYATDQTVVSGVLVKFDGVLQYFPWRFAPQVSEPDLFVSDYNGDGRKDVAFTYVYESGVQDRRETLHVLLREDKGFSDNLYTGDKAVIEAGRHLSVYADADTLDMFTANLDGKTTAFTLPGHGEYVDLYFDDVQDFTLGDEITVRLDPGIVFRNEGLPTFGVLTYTARIEFVDGILTQTNAKIDL